MRKRNKKIVCMTALSLVISTNIIANTGITISAIDMEDKNYSITYEINKENIDILSDTNITISDAKKWAKKYNATENFLNLADLYWNYSKSNGGVNPALAYVQAAHETGFGKFTGVLDESYRNPCGLKNTNAGIGDDLIKQAHKKFDNWTHGVLAHLDHLALYAGSKGYPKSNIEQSYKQEILNSKSTYDPRHFQSLYGSSKTVLDLSGKWANGNYGEKLVVFYNELINIS